jgi:hypothetical protein
MSRARIWILASIIGVVLTAATAGIASALSSEPARELIFWPNTVLQYLMPAPNIGTPDLSLYEGTPLNQSVCHRTLPWLISISLGHFASAL